MKRKFSSYKKKSYKKYKGFRKNYKKQKLVKLIKNVSSRQRFQQSDLHRSHWYINGSYIDTTGSTDLCVRSTSSGSDRDEGGLYPGTNHTRQGNRIFVKRIIINGSIAGNASANTTVIRMIVVKLLTSTIPALTDILDSTVNALQVYNPYNRINAGKTFEVVCDKKFYMSMSGKNIQPIKHVIRNVGEIGYSGSGITGFLQNNYNVYFVSDRATFLPSAYVYVGAHFYNLT